MVAFANLSLDESASVRAWRLVREAARSLAAAADVMLGAESAAPAPFAVDDSPEFSAEGFTVAQLVNEFLLAKARAGRSDRYLRQLRVSLCNFARGRMRSPIDQVNVGQIESWLAESDWSPRTKRGYLSDVRTLFHFAIRRNLARHNPAAGVELPTMRTDDPKGVHSPEQVAQLLEYARRGDLDVCRQLAVRYFAGVRTAEVHRLTEENVLLDRNLIDVTASKSKTRRRRLVKIEPNLRAWLELGGELRPIGPMTVRAVIQNSKVEWAQNVTRHSFVSYHLAHFQSAGKTALQSGHSEQMVFANYRELRTMDGRLITPELAAEFWNVRPAPA